MTETPHKSEIWTIKAGAIITIGGHPYSLANDTIIHGSREPEWFYPSEPGRRSKMHHDMITPPPHITPDFTDITDHIRIGVHKPDNEICDKPKNAISVIDFKNKTVTYVDLIGEPIEQNIVEETVSGCTRFYIDKNTVLQLKTLKEEAEECRNQNKPQLANTQT